MADYQARWEYIKSDPDGARSLLLLLHLGKGSPHDFDVMVDRMIASRNAFAERLRGGDADG